MRNRYLVLATMSLLAIALLATLARSADESQTAADKQKQPSPEEMMAIWMKYGTPGKEHEIFKSMEGKFDADVTMQMPGSPSPEKSTGTSTNKLIYDGRYLHADYSGTMMGKPFKGAGLWAYDKLKQKYMSLWIDDMSTMVMVAEGAADSSGKVITVKSKCMDPMKGKEIDMKQVLTVIDNDHHTYEAYQSDDGKDETKSVTIKYTRAK
jgi:Protein of unknown function (DUF1579)